MQVHLYCYISTVRTYTPVSGVPIVWRKLLHEQLLTHKVITKDEVVQVWFSLITNSSIIIKSYGSVFEAPRRGDSNTDAQLMIIVTIL